MSTVRGKDSTAAVSTKLRPAGHEVPDAAVHPGENFVGRLFSERLVKFDPRLDAFFPGLASEVVDVVNSEVLAAVG